jgi:hypothetical protein
MPVINQRQLVNDIPQIGQSIYMNSSIDVDLEPSYAERFTYLEVNPLPFRRRPAQPYSPIRITIDLYQFK